MENESSLKNIIANAEENEAKARILREYPDKKSCGFEYGSEACGECKHFDFCETDNTTRERAMKELFDIAYEEYFRVLEIIRQYLREKDSTENLELLGQVLMDIAINPNTTESEQGSVFWGGQYIWLHLYYKTGEKKYFEKAKLCDGFRHATVEKISE